MKRLKYSCLFHGHFYIVFAIFLLSPFAGVFAQIPFYHKLDSYSLNVICLSAWGIANVLILVLFAVILRIPKREERLLISEAEPPVWQPVTAHDLAVIRSKPSVTGCLALMLYPLMLLILGANLINNHFSTDWLITTAILLGGVTLILICAQLHWLFWHRITEDAVYASIPVHHCFTRTVYSRRHKQINHYMVCYLPDGKYVLKNDGYPTDPQTVHIVKYRGFFCCIPQSAESERTFT